MTLRAFSKSLPWLLLALATGAASPPAGERPIPTADDPVIVLVRHAEKMDDDPRDPSLTEAGHERARALAALLADAEVTAVLSTDYRRTRDTALPLARAAGLEIELYDPARLDALAADLRGRTGVVVVVGHSNTTPALVERLGGDPGPPIVEATEYDRLYVLHPRPDGAAATLRLRFGAPSPEPPPGD